MTDSTSAAAAAAETESETTPDDRIEPVDPVVPVEIGDRIYRLRLATVPFLQVEQVANGRGVMELWVGATQGRVRDVVALLWAMLLADAHDSGAKKSPTFQSAARVLQTWLDDGNSIHDVVDVLGDVIERSGWLDREKGGSTEEGDDGAENPTR